MFDFLLDVATESALAIITFLAGFLLSRLRTFLKKRRVQSVLKFDVEEKLDLNCFTANTGQYDEEERVTLGYVFEYMAAGEMRASFKKLYKEAEMKVKMSPEEYTSVQKRDVSQDLLLIGGPFHNSITRELVMNGRNGLPFYFDEDANLIYEGKEGRDVYCPELSGGANQYFENDYALILNIRNPLKKGKRILAFMGCRSIGCYGAAYYIAHCLKTLKRRVKGDEYAVVIRVEGDEEDIIDNPELVKYYPLSLTNPFQAERERKAASLKNEW